MFNCSSSWDECPCLTPDPDIAGRGVIASFIATSALCLICAMCALACNPIRQSNPNPNPVDAYFRKKTLHFLSPSTRTFYSPIFRALVISLADNQLATGIAILVVAWIRVSKDELSIYHLSVVSNLAGLAAITHITSLLALHNWLRGQEEDLSDKPKRRYLLTRITQALSMTLLFGVYIICPILLGGNYAYNHMYCPARCLLEKPQMGGIPAWVTPEVGLITVGYVAAILRLFDVRIWATTKALFSSKLCQPPMPRSLVSSLRLRHLFTSTVFEVFFEIVLFYFVVANLFGNLHYGAWYFAGNMPRCPASGSETEWGFGQVLPLLMLMIPVMTAVEAYDDQRCESQHEERLQLEQQFVGGLSYIPPITDRPPETKFES